MMRWSHCFVAVVPARTEQPGYSPYIKFEFDMARLARKPRFVVRSADASASAFSILPRDMQQEFDRSMPDTILPELAGKVRGFRQQVEANGVRVVSRSHHLGVPLASGRTRPPSFNELQDRLREVGGKHNYEVDVLDPERLDYGSLASLDHYDLLVTDVSGRYGLIRAERITSLHAEAIEVRPEAVLSGGDESLPDRWLLDAYQACRAIARVRLAGVRGGKPMTSKGIQRSWYGTGWMIDEGILVTNYHVIAGTDRDRRTEEDISSRPWA